LGVPTNAALTTALAGKANTTHAHALSDINSGISSYVRSLMTVADAAAFQDALLASSSGKTVFTSAPDIARGALSVLSITETTDLISVKVDKSAVGTPNNPASLDSAGRLPLAQLTPNVMPVLAAITGTYPTRPAAVPVEWLGPTVPPDLVSGDKWSMTAA